MLLAIDVGNTNIVYGLFEGERARPPVPRRERARAHRRRVRRAAARAARDARRRRRLRSTAAILACVVPSLTEPMVRLVEARASGARPSSSARASARAWPSSSRTRARSAPTASPTRSPATSEPRGGVIVVDFGTATTFDCVTPKGEYLGGVIAPGIQISADALFARAAKLPRVEIAKPPKVVGRNTVHAMQSGIVYGYVGLVDGLVERIQAELGFPCRRHRHRRARAAHRAALEDDRRGRRPPDADGPAHPLRAQPRVGPRAPSGRRAARRLRPRARAGRRPRACRSAAASATAARSVRAGHAGRTTSSSTSGCRACCWRSSPAGGSPPWAWRSRRCSATRSPSRTSSASRAARRSARPSRIALGLTGVGLLGAAGVPAAAFAGGLAATALVWALARAGRGERHVDPARGRRRQRDRGRGITLVEAVAEPGACQSLVWWLMGFLDVRAPGASSASSRSTSRPGWPCCSRDAARHEPPRARRRARRRPRRRRPRARAAHLLRVLGRRRRHRQRHGPHRLRGARRPARAPARRRARPARRAPRVGPRGRRDPRHLRPAASALLERVVHQPLPVGAVTALLGGPVFLAVAAQPPGARPSADVRWCERMACQSSEGSAAEQPEPRSR